MFLVYAALALFIVFGVYAIFTSMIRRDKKHEWVPTTAGGIIGTIAVLLFLIGAIWVTLQNLIQ